MAPSSKPRILFVGHTASISGPSHSLLMLVRHLKGRLEPAVLLPEQGVLCRWVRAEGIPCYIIPTLQADTIPRISRLVLRESFDVVYGNNPSGCSRNAMLAAKLARRPFIWHFRGMKWNWGWRQGIWLRGANAVVAVSHACAASIQRFYPREVHVVYNGVELSMFQGNRAAAREYLVQHVGASPRSPILVSVSHLTPRKGHEQGVALMARLVGKLPDAHFGVVGSLKRDVVYLQAIRAAIQEQGLGKRIHLLGLRTDVPRLLRGADVFVHTASQDPHPRAVIEAMAAGLPVAAFGVDGVAETVVDGQTGYLVPPGDVEGLANRVLALIRDPARAEEMGRRGRARVGQHFTAAGTAAQVGAIIEGLLPSRDSRVAP